MKKLDLVLTGLLILVYAGSNDDAVADDEKPYQVIGGKIDNNTLEGWKTYNGGECGACHGPGASGGGVAPNLPETPIIKNNDKETFKNIVTNGKPDTLMRPFITDKRVMDNLDNLYSYLKARSDGVLGPGDLLKYPLGKSE